jgi:magnesium chelatase subunit I
MSLAASSPSRYPQTLGALRQHGGFPPRTIKQEVRANVMAALAQGKNTAELFPGLIGYADTVLPQIINALLAGHDILLLGLRGQAKTRLARALTRFLDPAVPYLSDDPLRSHPFAPVGATANNIITRDGDNAAIGWLTPDERYGEKLATPDVSVADLIGDIDPIRASREGFDLGDLRSVTFGIVPRTNRGIFCINELPDLAPRIQVALFNILEEQDVQIRGIPLRLPLDLMLIFTANPEDYTSRGQIITPLKDRIGAQILTHYPKDRADGICIIEQEAHLPADDLCSPLIPSLFPLLIEEAARAARASEYVDHKSGVSARLTIAAMESLHANILRRGLTCREKQPLARLVDLPATLAAMTGKIELAYEGEQEGPLKVGWHVLGEAMRTVWKEKLPPVIFEADGKNNKDERDSGPWKTILAWFAQGNTLSLSDRSSTKEHLLELSRVPGLASLTDSLINPPPNERAVWMEFIVDGLFHGGALARDDSQRGLIYSDLLAHMMKRDEKKRKRL